MDKELDIDPRLCRLSTPLTTDLPRDVLIPARCELLLVPEDPFVGSCSRKDALTLPFIHQAQSMPKTESCHKSVTG